MHCAPPKFRYVGGVNTAPSIQLISLDFDGTILSYDDPAGVMHPDVIAVLNAAGARGVRWCANSGRQFEDQRDVIERSVVRGLRHLPDAYICCESVVYIRDGADYASFEPWNTDAFKNLAACHTRVQQRLGAQLDVIREKYQPVITDVGTLTTSFLLSDHIDAVFSLTRELEQSLAGMDDVHIIRNGGWVAVNHRALGKGNALRAFASYAGIPAAHILAMGDHHNDLTMLQGDVAAHVGCPGDAIPEVRQAVKRAGGRVGSLAGPPGTAEVIRTLLALDHA